MRVCQRLGNLPAEANDVGRRQVALRGDHRVERCALDVLHRDPRIESLAADVVDVTDIRMIERRRRASLLQHPSLCVIVGRVSGIGADELERHPPIEARVGREIDSAHPAAAERLENLVRSDPFADVRHAVGL